MNREFWKSAGLVLFILGVSWTHEIASGIITGVFWELVGKAMLLAGMLMFCLINISSKEKD